MGRFRVEKPGADCPTGRRSDRQMDGYDYFCHNGMKKFMRERTEVKLFL